MLDERGLQDTRLMMKMEELEKKINAKDVDGAMSRLETLESLVVSFKQQQDERGGQELKDMMQGLKSKYKFLEPSEESKQSTALTQLAVLEQNFAQLSAHVSSLSQSI